MTLVLESRIGLIINFILEISILCRLEVCDLLYKFSGFCYRNT